MLRKLVTALTSAAIVVSLTTAPQALAAERNMVVLGDSIIADSPATQLLADRFTSSRNCRRSPDSYAEQAGRRLGLPVRNFSCPGVQSISTGSFSGGPFNVEVDSALNSGALNTATARVVITHGFNDTYFNGGESEGATRARFVAAMRPQIDRIRAAAPHARIQIVGYPTIVTGSRICPLHIIPNITLPVPAGAMERWENLAQWMNVDLAHATGVEFLDLKPHTRNNGMCAPDADRYFSGVIDFTAGRGNMPLHINARGHERIGEILANS
ncbi:GDSL-type esterase/lipase family protein [Corynebacterium pseudotuberculosis]|uniref:Hydrolase n=1 Tax=Corynebacterium pseudotuberculosis (strain C231) TaxID=681645 RepID=D9QE05_CORP2|nr:GDSL-type esterase/lipase family protein [Corynebacterium pseudotuberculosis]ADK28024.1 hydrolase [Corynebacterium pseudotuberculosis FRC41]ADL09728.1 hydrolase [Corynebacterium pseudotuberculosis C231]ADL20134.1 hydrolase [Corynebacterium pseudotuberculosis 1002]ADO25523.1 hydrolase [Corynebacterium pseudotuberculosis I19]AEK91572.1 Secreted hydrolase [Corynebacterium pseudotuberculosis PAT10]